MDSVVGSSGGVVGPSVVDRPGKSAGNAGRLSASRFARLREHPQAERWARALIVLCALVLLAATLEIVLDAAVGHSVLVPKQPDIAGWLSGIGERLGYRIFLIALLAFTAAYAVLLGLAGRISKRWAIVLVGVLQLVVFAGPILISTDVFSYIAYARMGVEHGDQSLHARPDRDRPRSGLPVRRQRLEARRHRLRAAVHAALLSARAAWPEGRAVGDESSRRCSRARARSR